MSVETTLSLLRSRMTRLEPGHVWLAGAGPGDPGCLTLDVVSALSQADVVVYDALVDPAVVAIAEGAELFFVGKRGGKLSITQGGDHRAADRTCQGRAQGAAAEGR